jgi:urate oxidase
LDFQRGSILETIEEIRKTLQSKVKIGSSGEIFFSFSEDENTIDVFTDSHTNAF